MAEGEGLEKLEATISDTKARGKRTRELGKVYYGLSDDDESLLVRQSL